MSKNKALSGLTIARTLATLAQNKKANNIIILDISKQSSFADYFVICSAHSEKQVSAIARHIQSGIKKINITTHSMEGLNYGQWVLGDFGDVIIHVFHKNMRLFYDLESFWSTAPRIKF